MEQIQALLPWNVKVVLDEQKEIAGTFAAVRRLTATPYPGFRGKNQYGDNRALLGDQMAATPALAALASSNAVGGVLSSLLSSP